MLRKLLICTILVLAGGTAVYAQSPEKPNFKKQKQKVTDAYESSIDSLNLLKKDFSGFKYRGSAVSTKGSENRALFNSELSALDLKRETSLGLIELEELLVPAWKGNLMTHSNFSDYIKKQFRTVSGTEIKNGKYVGTSASVDEESMTINLSFKPSKKKEWYIQPVLKGKAEDSFVDIFNEGKYGRTLTGGVNVVILQVYNTGKFKNVTRSSVHEQIRKQKTSSFGVSTKTDSLYYAAALDSVRKLLKGVNASFIVKNYQDKKVAPDDTTNLKARNEVLTYSQQVDTLMKVNLLPENFTKLDLAAQLKIVQLDFAPMIHIQVLNNYLQKIHKIQQDKAVFTSKRLSWVTFGGHYSQKSYKIASTESPDLYNKLNDGYFKGNVSNTFMWWQKSGNRFYASPTLSFQNPRKFDSDDELHAMSFSNYPIGNSTVQKVEKDFKFYADTARKVQNLAIELPLAYYFSKYQFGLELVPKVSFDDPEGDDFNVRFGVLLPFNLGKSNALVLEPIVKFRKLQDKVHSLWKENTVFGINLSVAIPTSFFE